MGVNLIELVVVSGTCIVGTISLELWTSMSVVLLTTRSLQLLAVYQNATTQCYDQRKRKDNKSGRTGVCWDNEAGKWVATIAKHGRQHKLGRFANIEDAIKRRELAELEFYGELKQECKK